MEINKKSVYILNRILHILSGEKCTIEEAINILSYGQKVICKTSTVQFNKSNELKIED